MFNINEFIEYLQMEIKKIKKQINAEKQRLAALPNPDEIVLKEYGSKKELIDQYFEDKKTFGKLVVYFKKENKLKQKIVENKKNNLSSTLKLLEAKKQRYEKIIATIKTTGKLPTTYPNEELIKLLMDYASNNAINPYSFFQELLTLLDGTIKNNQSNDLLFDMEKALLEFFTDGSLKSDASLSSLSFTFNNFLKELSSVKQNQDTKIYSENLKLFMKLLTTKTTDKKISETKTKLATRQQALEETRKYVKYHKIIGLCDNVNRFTQTLRNAGFDNKTINDILIGMQNEIRDQKIKEADSNIKQTITKKISPDSYKVIETTKQILKSKNNVLYDLIKRKYEDIISLCTYISMDEANIWPNNIDVLVEKLAELEMIIKISKDKKGPQVCNYNYLINQDSNICFSKDLEFLDISLYDEIVDLLEMLLSNELPLTLVQKTKDNIKISKIGGAPAIYVASKNGLNFIIGICTESTKNAFLSKLETEQFQLMLSQAFKEARKDKDFIEKQQKYNQIVINTLSPKNNIKFTK